MALDGLLTLGKKSASGGLGSSLYESATVAKTQALKIIIAAMATVY